MLRFMEQHGGGFHEFSWLLLGSKEAGSPETPTGAENNTTQNKTNTIEDGSLKPMDQGKGGLERQKKVQTIQINIVLLQPKNTEKAVGPPSFTYAKAK